MKIDNFLNKVDTEVQIINKQTESLYDHSGITPSVALKESQQKIDKFLFNQVKIMEDSMKYLNDETVKVRTELKASSDVLLAKMTVVELKRKDFQ
jgi:hypothetical protein